MSINNVVLYGNLTRDPEMIGEKGVKFRLAWNEKWTDKNTGETKEKPGFINVVVWGNQRHAIVEYMKQGSPVMVEGRLDFSQWETNEGESRSEISINGRSVQFLNKAPSSE